MECMPMITDQMDTKYCNVKEFVKAARQYLRMKTEESANDMSRYLQILSVTIDYSIFDPHQTITTEFFICLYDLLSMSEIRSSLAWCCIDVLSIACRNPSARKELICTYEFVPPLSKLLGDHLGHDKKIKLLTLLQELTCGIKISWQIPHLPNLMTLLSKWIESDDEEVSVLSLGTLVNLCYKNLPAIYTLSRSTNIKKLMRICLSNTTPRMEMYTCKLLIILEQLQGEVQDSIVMRMIEVMFKTLGHAIAAGDCVTLRHIVDFFMECKNNQKEQRDKLHTFENYYPEVERLLQIIENNLDYTGPCGDKQLNPECVAIIFEFLLVIIEMRIDKFATLHRRIIDIALKWIHTDSVCHRAIIILRTIAIDTEQSQYEILGPIVTAVPTLAVALDNDVDNVDNINRMGAIMHLFCVLSKENTFRSKILLHLKMEVVHKIFNALSQNKANMSEDRINMYVYGLSLINVLANFDEEWCNYKCKLLQQKQIYYILAQGLFNGGQNIKLSVLECTSSNHLFMAKLSSALCDINVTARIREPINVDRDDRDLLIQNLPYGILSVSDNEKLDESLQRLNRSLAENDPIRNVATSNVVELYEYKMASLSYAELTAMNSAEAASRRCSHLQHRIAQLNAELTRTNQMLYHKQQEYDNLTVEKEEFIKNINGAYNKIESEKGLNKVLKNKLAAVQEQLDETERSYAEQKNITEKRLVKKEELLKKLNLLNEKLQQQNRELEETIKTKENKLATQMNELKSVREELEIKKSIVDAITKLASGKK